jgi:hypothetical protein
MAVRRVRYGADSDIDRSLGLKQLAKENCSDW